MSLAIGSRLGPYQIEGPLGAGGMGEVYRARDTRLGRFVAVKTLPERLAQDPQALARFEHKARAVAALSHSSILALHDFGTDGGVCYAVMELLEGQTLRRLLLDGPLPWSRAVEVGIAVADGLVAAHVRGVVHRDLKPENLFVTSDGQVKILDFGLARIGVKDAPRPDTGMEGEDTGLEVPPTASYDPAHTQPGLVMGTAGYMSPEQVRGQAADGRTDMFSLGCVLYEMLTGRKAFAGATRAEVLAATLHDDLPPCADSGRDVPGELERVVRHCLEKRPEDRFQSARDLAFDLRAMRSESIVSRSKVSAPARRFSFPVVQWGLAALLVLAAGGFYYFADRGKDKPASDGALEVIAVLPFDNESRDPALDFLSNGLSESIIIHLSSLPSLKVRPFSSVAQYQGQKPDLQAVGRNLKVQAVLVGRVLQQGEHLSVSVEMVDVRDDSHIWGDRYDRKTADLVAIEEEIARQVSEKLRIRLSAEEQKRFSRHHTPSPEAFQLYLQGRHSFNTASTEAQTRKAIDFYKKAIATDPKYPLVHAALAEAYYWLSNIYLPPTEAIPRAKEAALTALELDDTLGEAHALLGLFYAVYDWDWPAADREFRRAVALNPGSATAHLYHGLYLVDVQRFDEAIVALDRARECDPSSIFLRGYAVFPLYLARRYDQAISQAQSLIDTDPKHFPPYAYLALAYEQIPEYDKAIAAFRTLLDLDAGNLEAKAQLGHVYAVARKKEEALRVLKELMDLPKGRYISPYNIAMIHLGLGDREQAFAWLTRAGEDHSEWFACLKVDPRLDPLRGDPRFDGLLRRARLGP